MTTYVLVHGASAGGFVWRDVAKRLRHVGHDVYTPTLTGLGERVHLAHPAIDLDVHVQDILGVLHFEQLTDIVLVGHSYAGMVISGIAEQVPERLRHLVYVDALLPRDGESFWDIATTNLAAPVVAAIQEAIDTVGDGWRVPAPAKRSDGVDFPEGRPQPLKTFTQPLVLRNPHAAALPRTYIYCSQSPPEWRFRPVIAACAARAQTAGWAYQELPTSHAVYATMPGELTALLLALETEVKALPTS